MGNEVRFQDRWDFRRNEGEFHSSSDDSNDKPVSKKHKLVSSLISDKNDETNNAPGLPENIVGVSCTVDPTKSKKRQRTPNMKGKIVKKDTKRKIESFRKVSRKKCKSNTDEPASLESLKLFMESLMKDLHVASEELFVWVREEMDKLMESTTKRKPRRNAQENVKVKSQNKCESGLKLLADQTTHLSNVGSGSQFEKSNCGSLAQSFKSPKVADSKHPYLVSKNQGEDVQHNESDQVHHQNNACLGWKVDKCNGGSSAQLLKSPNAADSNHLYQMSAKHGEHNESDQANHQNNIGSGWKIDKSNPGSLAESLKSLKAVDSDHPYQMSEKQGEHVQCSESDQAHYQNNIGSGWKDRKCNGSLAQSLKPHKVADSNHPYWMSEKQGEHVQHTESDQAHHETNVGSGWKIGKCSGGSLAQSLKSPKVTGSSYPNRVAKNQAKPDQVASSMYLTLPSVIHEPQFKTPKFNSPAYNQTPPGIPVANIERVNLMPKPSQRSYLLGMPKEQHGVQNVNCFVQNTSITSCIGSGFPIQFHQDLDRGFSIPNRVGTENQPHGHNNNIMGLKMDGGSLNLSQCSLDYFSDNLQSNLGYKADSRHMTYPTQNPKGGSLFSS